ncbi:NtaA/DmoA family FMN-dependent monooxygenase [Streptomyces sp. SID8361]|uniref:NtaA/DmoA family FMN-dependent monooxygenase n=1 Tax=Streptomyces sp. MnatMP-M27 TaxID=1839768 RepID=UPI00081ED35B|nr:NtaA/DmoA family FMN-dependent monooxygenase [Streptomyces sp. MnatMP-M27]MYU11098.1 NtaA/DmoA family FMN-dependent monooxygenase [Streptomyces sp. SID8361]SCF78255.1 FMN-dependent oxidoreductase, nitrilotriacetate monooxygenase family [Streptomyces sp. MnatMP-M27]
MTRRLILNVNVLDFGQTISARDFSGLPAARVADVDYYVEQAKAAERGTLDALFLADGPALQGDPRGRGGRALEPSLILTAIAEATDHLGVIGTLSTTYNDPVELADRLLALDHVSGGRAAWNAVTTYSPPAADNFGLPGRPDRATRYRRADEFVDVVLGLWQAAVDGVDPHHDGEFFHIHGRLPLGASPQGHPLLLQAGGSPQGRELAGRAANGVFTAELTLDAGIEHYELVKKAAVRHGRSRGDLAVLPGLITVVGSTHAEAEERLTRTRELLPRDHETVRLSGMLGYDLRGVGLDDPFPQDALGELADPQAFTASLGFRESLVRALSKRPYTFREVLDEFGNGGHRRVVGSPEEIADTIQEWFEAGAADGFNLMPDAFPSGLDDFVDQVVPVLRKRGLFRHEYEEKTLRGRWGFGEPKAAHQADHLVGRSFDAAPESRGDRFLRHFGPDPVNWVRETETDHDVVVVGGGQAGLGIGFALRRAGIGRLSVIDAAAPGATGVWKTIARMHTLRTPKIWPEPEFGHPELSFRAWYEERHGQAAYEALDRIPRLPWAAYIDWIEDTLRVPVRHRTRLVSVAPHEHGLALELVVTDEDGNEERRTEVTRRLVFANGVEGTGGFSFPEAFDGLPRELYAHTGEPIDFDNLTGKKVGVLGAGASALDAAATALEAGAAEAHVFTRREKLLIQGDAPQGPANIGARENFHRRPDAERWKLKVTTARAGRSCTLASVERATAFDGFAVHLSAGWNTAIATADGVQVEADDGTHRFDFLIAGTGYQYDPDTQAELAPIADQIALWEHRYQPPDDLANAGLGRWPYLGDGYEFQEREPGKAPWGTRIHVFSAGAAMSFGIPVGDTQSLPTGIPRLVDAVGAALFAEDATLPPASVPGGTPGQSTEDPFLRFYVGHVRQAAATEG